MTSIEIFALIVVIVAAIKVIVILISPKSWLSFAEKLWKAPTLAMSVSLVLSAVVLYYLLQSLSIVDIFAVILFIALLSAMTLSVYSKDFLAMAKKMVRDRNFFKRAWLPILIWLILIIWAAKEILI